MGVTPDHEHWMGLALEQADLAARRGEAPIGAVLVQDGRLLAAAHNRCIAAHDATAHAEIEVVRAAGAAIGNYRLGGSILYVTLEPCVMCAGAVVNGRVGTLVYGADDARAGAAGSVCNILETPFLNHRCAVVRGVRGDECRARLIEFFARRR